jgi:hypothetical protein
MQLVRVVACLLAKAIKPCSIKSELIATVIFLEFVEYNECIGVHFLPCLPLGSSRHGRKDYLRSFVDCCAEWHKLPGHFFTFGHFPIFDWFWLVTGSGLSQDDLAYEAGVSRRSFYASLKIIGRLAEAPGR